MAIVIVCTSDKLHESISEIDTKYRHANNLQRYIAPVLTDFFLNSPLSDPLRTRITSQVYSCTLERLESAFNNYIDDELADHPDNEKIIHQVRDIVLDLFQSDWLINNNLVVQECLEDSDFASSNNRSSHQVNRSPNPDQQ